MAPAKKPAKKGKKKGAKKPFVPFWMKGKMKEKK